MPRELSDPLTDEDKAWLRSRNMPIPGEEGDEARAQVIQTSPETSGPAGTEVKPEDAPALSPGEYDDATNAQLQTELGRRELPKSGNKDELLARLREDDASREGQQG
jgi:hypothetical protein